METRQCVESERPWNTRGSGSSLGEEAERMEDTNKAGPLKHKINAHIQMRIFLQGSLMGKQTALGGGCVPRSEDSEKLSAATSWEVPRLIPLRQSSFFLSFKFYHFYFYFFSLGFFFPYKSFV